MAKLPAFLSHNNNQIAAANTVLVATSTASTDYQVSNVRILPITKTWRSFAGQLSSIDITIDFGSAQAISLIALINHNLSATATIAIAAGTTSAVGNYSTTISYRQYDAFGIIATQTYQYWRVRITDTANADGYLEVGYLLLGAATTLTQAFMYGWKQVDEYQNQELSSEFGVPLINEMFYRMRFSFTFRNQTSARADAIRTIFKDVKRNVTPLFFVPDTGTNDGYFGRFVASFERQMDFRITTNSMDFVEDSRGKKLIA